VSAAAPAAPTPRLTVSPPRRAWRAMWGRAYPRIIGQNRDKSWVFYDTVLPLLGTLAFVYVYKALDAPDQYVGYVIMGGATTAFWLNVMWGIAAQFYWDKSGGNLELYMIAPCGLVPILLGMSVGGLLATTLRAVAIVALGSWLFQVHYELHEPLVFVAIFVVAMIGLYAMGTAFASLFLMWGREAWHTVNLFMEPVFLLSGLYFPVAALGGWVALGASLIPLTLALDAMRQLVFGAAHPAFLPARVELALLVLLDFVFIVFARWCLKRMDHLARREARLSLRY
jgi:ABC-2 type transport system permease protein